MRSRVSALVLFAPAIVLAACFALFTPASARADSPYVEGLELYRQGKFDDAAKTLRAGLPQTPQTSEATAPPAIPTPSRQATLPAPLSSTPPADTEESPHLRAVLGFTLLKLNHLPEAEEQFDIVRHNADMAPVGLLGAGWAAYARGRTSAAVRLFEEALRKAAPAPGQPPLPDMLRESVPMDARLALGLIALGRDDPAEALKQLEAGKDGQDVLGSPKEYFLALGDARARMNDPRGAVDAWSEVSRHDSHLPGDAPHDELARLKTARLQENGGMADAALSGYAALSRGSFYRAEALQGQARVLLARGQTAQALPVLRRLVNEDPNMVGALAEKIQEDPLLRPVLKDWGLAYFHRASYRSGREKLVRYLDDVDPADTAGLIGVGWCDLRLGQPGDAQHSFGEALAKRPNDPGAMVGLAASAMAMGDPGRARGLISRALALDPKNALALGTLGHLELSQGNTQKGLDDFRAALKSRPDYVDARLSAARILFDRGDYDASAAEFFRLVTQERRSSVGWNGLGWARLRLGAYDEALSAFAEARRQNPNVPVGAYGMGVTLAREGRADQASQRLAEAIFLNPDFSATPEVLELMRSRPEYTDLFLEMGEAYARRLYPTTAAPYLEEYLRQNPNSREGRRSLAWASFWAGQEDKAHALFQTLITVNKDDADAHLGDGLALLSRGHLNLAEPHLRDAVRLDSKNARAWRALTLLLRRQGRVQEAEAAQKQAPQSRLERLDRMSASGFAALSEGRLHDAMADFHRAVALDPGLAAPHYGLAFTLVEVDDVKQARDELLAGMNLDPAYLDDQELSDLLGQHAELNALAVDLSWSQLYALNLPAARAGFERILGGSPSSMEALFGLGATAYLQADWATAEHCFDKLLPRAPLTSPSWDKWCHLMDKLGWSAYQQHKYNKALHVFSQLRDFHPDTPYAEALDGMGWALMGKGQDKQAENLFARSLNIFPRNLTAVQGMLAMQRSPEGEDEDYDVEPAAPVKKSGKHSKRSKHSKRYKRGGDSGDEQAEVAEKPSKKSKKKGKKSRVENDEAAVDEAPVKVSKSKKKHADQDEEKPSKKHGKVSKSKKKHSDEGGDEAPAKVSKSKKKRHDEGDEAPAKVSKSKKKAAGEGDEAPAKKKHKKKKK